MASGCDAVVRKVRNVALLTSLFLATALSGFAEMARAACPCDVDPTTICTSGDCSALPALNYDEIFQALHEVAATEGELGDGRVSCGGNFSDITAVAGIRRGPYPGSLSIRAETDKCLAVQTYDDENGVMQTNSYYVDGIIEADAAQCLAAVHRVCADASRP